MDLMHNLQNLRLQVERLDSMLVLDQIGQVEYEQALVAAYQQFALIEKEVHRAYKVPFWKRIFHRG